ncbi:glycosyltransferase [Paenibacillus sp. HJL G12]|uniref:Glycosyltransferase n=1 Tax=Paenibacillus dendrobii TaxID=2691084 RepID=A0A7X3IMU2_9BACL|nr:glycosyltransferase [Paenibacillus dendrobii]MWV46859.1 glycosyltransferase [Paenibacillus dendrobii]
MHKPSGRKRQPQRKRKRSSTVSLLGRRSCEHPVVSVIIPAMNEQKTIGHVIKGAWQVHEACEVIVVANGCTDRTADIAETMGAKVLRFEQALGHDVGRAVGAEAASGHVLLFIDADMRMDYRHLRHFVDAVLSGTDIALNRYRGPVHKRQAHPVVLAKHTLNSMLSRSDLLGASLTAVPHAMNRRAVEVIGSEHLATPPLALAMAVHSGLKVAAVHEVPVGRMNRRRGKTSGQDLLQQVVIEDHLKALDWYLSHTDPRGGHSDLGRDRDRVGR